MADSVGTETTTAGTEAAAEVKPLGEVNSLAEYRSRRDEAPAAVETTEAEGEDGEGEEVVDTKATASEAGKALAAKKKSLQGRIDEITAEKHQTAGELTAARREIAELRAQMAGRPAEETKPAAAEAVAVDPNDPEPQVEAFDDYQKYVKAQARWEARQEFKAQQAESDKRAQSTGIQRAQQRVADTGAKAHEDFDAVMTKFEDAGGEYSPVAIDVICGHELGHEFAYRMAKDPALAKRINGAASHQAAIFEAGKLIARIEQDAEDAKAGDGEKPAPKLSKAPAPIARRDGGGESASAPDPKRINSVAEYRRVRDKIAA